MTRCLGADYCGPDWDRPEPAIRHNRNCPVVTGRVTVKLYYYYIESNGDGRVRLKWFSSKDLRDAYGDEAHKDPRCEDPSDNDGMAEFRIDPESGEILSDPRYNNVNPVYEKW